MTIHTSHPFAGAEPDPARRLRGRIGGGVTLWTAGDDAGTAAGVGRAGLTVTSVMVALGPEPRLLALIDPDSDLLRVVRTTGRAVVQLLCWSDRQLAEAFAGTAPAPGGPFRQAAFTTTPYGPLLAGTAAHAFVSLVGEREVGWSVEAETRIDEVVLGQEEQPPLLHRRGRFVRVPE